MPFFPFGFHSLSCILCKERELVLYSVVNQSLMFDEQTSETRASRWSYTIDERLSLTETFRDHVSSGTRIGSTSLGLDSMS